MSKKTIILLLYGFISIKGFAQVNINDDRILINSSITADTMKLYNIKTDSTLNMRSIIQDSLVSDTAHQGKNSRLPKEEKTIKIQGTISNGYEYGVSPYLFNHGVTGFYKSEGNFGFEALAIPLNIRYSYSTLNVVGLNNTFSVSFDVNKYKENIKKRISRYEEQYTSKLDSQFLYRQKLVQKRAFLELEIGDKQAKIEALKSADYSELNSHSSKINSDSISNHILGNNINGYSNFTIDTLRIKDNLPSLMIDSTKMLQPKIPSQKNISANIDSLQNALDDYKQRADQITDQIDEADKSIKKIQTSIQSLKEFNGDNKIAFGEKSLLSKYKNFLFDVKKFEIGLCYPSYSDFLIKGAVIKGVNVEFENTDFFVAFSHGTSVNTFVNPLNAVESNLNKFKQMFDFLDFSNQGQQRKLTSMMFGLGKKQGNHLHVGLLYGTGNAYMNQYLPLVSSNDKNYVIELDGRAVINKNSFIDFSYGKSSIQGQNEILESNERGFAGVFTSKRTNAALVSIHTQIPKVNTKVQVSVRWLDPYFKSYGVGFMKSDNLRYEIKADQRLSKQVNVSCLFRKSEDNLLNLFDYKNKLNTIGAGTSIKWSKRLSTKINYNMILQSMNVSDGNSYNSKSYISTYILNYQIPKAKTLITGIYNDYNIADANSTNRFQNVLFSGTTDVGRKIKNSFSVNILKSNMKDSLSGNSAMISNDVVLIHKRFSVSFNGKYAFIDGRDNQFGYGIKATVSVCKSILLEGSFERIVYGSYYNYITVDQIEKFPYYCAIKLNYIWK